jgi:quercetin dioxygenase-like cupin family protein
LWPSNLRKRCYLDQANFVRYHTGEPKWQGTSALWAVDWRYSAATRCADAETSTTNTRVEAVMRRFAMFCATLLVLGSSTVFAQQAQSPKVSTLVSEAPVTGVADKVFTLITADWPPGVTTGRHTHPGDEYGTVVEGTLVTRQEGGEWKTVTSGQSYYVPGGAVHETKNEGNMPAKSYNAFIVEKGKPRATPVQ